MNKITIDPKETIDSIRKQISASFPFLDLQCFKKMHSGEEGSAKKSMYQPDTKLASLMAVGHTVVVSFTLADTVKEFEKRVKDISGLNAQIFRKSGKLWLETTVTDSWTLQQQNEEGERSVSEVKEETESADDHDIY